MDNSGREGYIDSMKTISEKNEMLIEIESLMRDVYEMRAEDALGAEEFFALRGKLIELRRMVRRLPEPCQASDIVRDEQLAPMTWKVA